MHLYIYIYIYIGVYLCLGQFGFGRLRRPGQEALQHDLALSNLARKVRFACASPSFSFFSSSSLFLGGVIPPGRQLTLRVDS